MPVTGTVLGQPCPMTDQEQAPGRLVVLLVDVDDYEVTRLTRGERWATDQLDRVEKIIERMRAEVLGTSRLGTVPPDAWLVAASAEHAASLSESAWTFAETVRATVAAETEATVTISMSRVQPNPPLLRTAVDEAVHAMQRKLVDGGDRICRFADTAAGDLPLPRRVEEELGRCIRDGDAKAAADVLRSWIELVVRDDGVTPDLLRRWIGAELLYALDVAGKRRLADGSADWIEALSRLSLDDLLKMSEIHERSYLMLWLEDLLLRIVDARTPPSPGRHILSRVEAFVHEHYADELHLATVAQAVYVSPYYVSHLFHRELGTTFLKYLTGVRMQHARHLLAHTSLPVETVAGRVGYCTPKRFRTVFKRTFHLTPAEYRRRHQNGAADLRATA